MYRVSVRKHFDAAHYLREYQGQCENLHGHRFQTVVTLETEQLDDLGMAMDFSDIKRYLGQIMDRYDHACLNEVPPFDKINPSSENLAATICRELSDLIGHIEVKISSVEVWESPDAWATYIPPA